MVFAKGKQQQMDAGIRALVEKGVIAPPSIRFNAYAHRSPREIIEEARVRYAENGEKLGPYADLIGALRKKPRKELTDLLNKMKLERASFDFFRKGESPTTTKGRNFSIFASKHLLRLAMSSGSDLVRRK